MFKSFKFWEPNEERLHLLKGYRFVLLCDAEGQVDADTRELIIRGDGEYECFPLKTGEAKWRQMLAKAKRKVDEAGLKVAIIARELVVQATVGENKWRDMTAEAQRYTYRSASSCQGNSFRNTVSPCRLSIWTP